MTYTLHRKDPSLQLPSFNVSIPGVSILGPLDIGHVVSTPNIPGIPMNEYWKYRGAGVVGIFRAISANSAGQQELERKVGGGEIQNG